MGLNVAELHRRLAAGGMKLSLRTLHRYLAGNAAAPGAEANEAWQQPQLEGEDIDDEAPAAVDEDRFSPTRLLGDVRQRYLAAWDIANKLQGPASLGGPESKKWADMSRFQSELAERLARMAPPPAPDPEHDPEYVAAKDRLLERAREIAAEAAK